MAGDAGKRRDWTVRLAAPADAAALLALWRAAEATPSPTDDLDGVRRLLAEPGAAVLVAERGGMLVGSAIAGFDGWRGNLYRLAVHPDHRRRGVARALVAEAERWRRAGGPESAWSSLLLTRIKQSGRPTIARVYGGRGANSEATGHDQTR